ncbi:hypothetical protein LOTGIDRAFT_159506 [Lottia gigantea]|uniref:Uncharacterized protein n=1 Tax=Lottia gigantea TaxID=225164 RepID=V4AK51_LOTGI|nr:hypothetical protein LOTGIDRAFT_159506 [Lottia gigantea]ESO97472.1 hypothetical protein LOTGIDRAFT_159506 [Lottia gigantea]
MAILFSHKYVWVTQKMINKINVVVVVDGYGVNLDGANLSHHGVHYAIHSNGNFVSSQQGRGIKRTNHELPPHLNTVHYLINGHMAQAGVENPVDLSNGRISMTGLSSDSDNQYERHSDDRQSSQQQQSQYRHSGVRVGIPDQSHGNIPLRTYIFYYSTVFNFAFFSCTF